MRCKSPKHQPPSSRETSNLKLQTSTPSSPESNEASTDLASLLVFGTWSFSGGWCLELGASPVTSQKLRRDHLRDMSFLLCKLHEFCLKLLVCRISSDIPG